MSKGIRRCAVVFGVGVVVVGIVAGCGSADGTVPRTDIDRAPSRVQDGPALYAECAPFSRFAQLDCSTPGCNPCEQLFYDAWKPADPSVSPTLTWATSVPTSLSSYDACFVGAATVVAEIVADPSCAGLTATADSLCPGMVAAQTSTAYACVDPLCPGGDCGGLHF
jgi:hypothetical protein